MRRLLLGLAFCTGFALCSCASLVQAKVWEPEVEPPSDQMKKLEGRDVQILGYVDVDGDGARQLKQLENSYGAIPDTVTVTTARGRHLYYRHPAWQPIDTHVQEAAEGQPHDEHRRC